ncbi:MAG: hypothetical protein SPI77_03555 [Corynebacterium sp.]|nr:hypothetical protein [Corynebacterium sp.]
MLSDEFLGPRRADIVAALSTVAVNTVASTGGMTGMALKGALKAAQSVRADAVPVAIDAALPQVAEALSPFWEAYAGSSPAAVGGFGAYLESRSDEVTDALVGVADSQQANMPGPVQKLYGPLRKRAATIAAGALKPLGTEIESFLHG